MSPVARCCRPLGHSERREKSTRLAAARNVSIPDLSYPPTAPLHGPISAKAVTDWPGCVFTSTKDTPPAHSSPYITSDHISAEVAYHGFVSVRQYRSFERVQLFAGLIEYIERGLVYTIKRSRSNGVAMSIAIDMRRAPY